MKKKLANILSEIDLEIDEIDLYGYDIIPVSLAMVHRLQGILSDLRNDLQTYVFPSKEEEIYFFKNQKPELLGRLLYFHKIYRIEVQCPTGSNDVIRLYLNKELDSFLRGKVDFRLCTDSAQFDKDPNFSTGYDYKVAKILANEMLRIYLNKKLQKLECDSYIEEKQTIATKTPIRFTGKKNALIELGYALVSSGDINHGNIEIKEFMEYLSSIFNIDLGGYYDAYIAMKERKDQTAYLKKLEECLAKRMDEK